MRIAVVGATGLVGSTMLKVLAEREFSISTFIPVASSRSVGQSISFKDKEYHLKSAEEAIALKPDIALFSAGGSVSLELAPLFAAVGTRVIDNSSAWRMDATKKLIVPEVNGDELTKEDFIIANPNCSTIQMVMVLKPLHDAFTIKRVVVSTYQSITGTGQKAVEQLQHEQQGGTNLTVYPHPIHDNILPHIDVFAADGYTKEEWKMIQETTKIMGDEKIAVTATCVRVPVMGGHSESLNIEFEKPFDLQELKDVLVEMPGLSLLDDVSNNLYPMPKNIAGKDEVQVGRIRRDNTVPNGINCWVVADNLRKGAATNAVQIAELLVEKKFVG